MKNSFLQDLINDSESIIPPMWINSKHEGWYTKINNQSKGKIGARIVTEFLKERGYETRIISNKGDIEYKSPQDFSWKKAEVKAAKADLKKLKKQKDFVTEDLWFNQIRPKQSGWEELFLVGIYPNHWRIWRKSREEVEAQINEFSSFSSKLSHIETDGNKDKNLFSVGLEKNSNKNNFDEWDEIFNNQEGELY